MTGFSCVRCLGTPQHPAPAVALDGLDTVCIEHLAAAWREEVELYPNCVRCHYWRAEAGELCGTCAEDVLNTRHTEHR